jgi:serine/threonine protein kinase
MTCPTRIGPYEIIRPLGKSMTDVYLARDTVAQRHAALKLIKSSQDVPTRLILEAERRGALIQMQLRELDPRVVEVYDYGDLEGYFFVAMQYLEGSSLAEVLERDERLEPRRAARIAGEICALLEKFHSFQAERDGPRRAVVHGDIKPSNIHVGRNDTVRLLDFGIAKTLAPNRDYTVHEFGSPSYCSPERLECCSVDVPADLWAVGVTLYEMVAGRPPYQAENTQKLERLIRSGLPPRALPENCPPGLRSIIAKALAPRPEHRYLSAAAFRADLQAYLEGAATAAEQESHDFWSVHPTVESAQPPPSDPRRRSLLWKRLLEAAAMAGCFLLGMAVLIGTVTFSHYWKVSGEIRSRPDYAHLNLSLVNADWNAWQGLEAQLHFLGVLSPAGRLRSPLAAAYQAGAEAVIRGYRDSTDPQIRNFDWRRAQLFLERASELGASGPEIAGELALCRGYDSLLRAGDWKGTDRRELFAMRQTAWTRFSESAHSLNRSPDPHLALARIYVYALPSLERAMSEFRAAERLGYLLKPREIEQEADAYRIRAQQRWREGDRQSAVWNAVVARRLYERIAGFGKADLHAAQMRNYQAAVRKGPVRRARQWR